MKTEELTAGEANEIHRQWMALHPNAPADEQRRVVQLVERLPRCYVSVAENGMAVLVMRSTPLNAENRLTVAEVVEMATARKVQTRLRWYGEHGPIGMWIEATAVATHAR